MSGRGTYSMCHIYILLLLKIFFFIRIMDLPVIAENTGLRLSFERGIANSTPGTGRYGVKYLSYQVRDSLIVYVERRISGSLRCFVARSTLDLLCDQWYEWDPGGAFAMQFSVCRMGAGFGSRLQHSC